jgi:hypothetical protein
VLVAVRGSVFRGRVKTRAADLLACMRSNPCPAPARNLSAPTEFSQGVLRHPLPYSTLKTLQDPGRYYRLLMAHTSEVLPYVYTPTVGEACQAYHRLGVTPRGLYLTLEDDRPAMLEMLRTFGVQGARAVVMTDGGRILGLGACLEGPTGRPASPL